MYLKFFEYCSIPDEETISLDYSADRVLFPTITTAMKRHAKHIIMFIMQHADTRILFEPGYTI